MIRFVLRTLGLWILAGAFVVVVYDGTRSIAGNALIFTKLEDIWNFVFSRPMDVLLKPLTDRYVGQWLWELALLPLLHSPAFLTFAVLGAILMLLGRKKKPLIGYAR
jgi:hypothetical protein